MSEMSEASNAPEPTPLLTTAAPKTPPTDACEESDVAAFLDHLRHARRLSPATSEAYERDVRKFFAWVQSGGLPCYLRPDARRLGGFLEHLHGEGLSAASINRHFTGVKTFYRFLRLRGRISTAVLSEVLDVKGPECWERLPIFLTPEQVVRLMQSPCPLDRYYVRDLAILELLYASGCRASELCNLLLADLRLSEGEAAVLGKGNKPRILLLNQHAIEAIGAYLELLRPWLVQSAPDVPWLFVSKSAQPLSREMLWNVIQKYARRIGIVGVGPHTLRHSTATHLMNGGADLRVIQELMGHSSIGTTQRYLHVDTGRMRELHSRYHPRGSTPAPETSLPDAA